MKWCGLDEEAQESQAIITLDSPERASDAILALEGATQETSKEAYALLEYGSLARRPPDVNKVVGEALSKIVVGPSFSTRIAMVGLYKPRDLDILVLKSPIKPTTWDQPSADASVPDPNKAQSSTTGTPSTRGTRLSLICMTSTPSTFGYLWWRFLRSILFPSRATWIKKILPMCG